MPWTNPFRLPTKLERETLRKQLILQTEAEQRFQQLLASYRAIVSDPRYVLVSQDLGRVWIEQVNRLITKAATCPTCAAYAERVLVLDLVKQPREAVDYAAQTQRATEESEEMASDLHDLENGHEAV